MSANKSLTNHIYIYIYIYIKDFALNTPQGLICHKTPADEPANQPLKVNDNFIAGNSLFFFHFYFFLSLKKY